MSQLAKIIECAKEVHDYQGNDLPAESSSAELKKIMISHDHNYQGKDL